MKGLVYITVISSIICFACNKSSGNLSGVRTSVNWQLANNNQVFGPHDTILIPAKDSSVLLVLNSDSTFSSELNGKLVSSGSYRITPDTSYSNLQVLQLNNFKTTGIFSLFTVYELGGNGQILSEFDGFFLKISSDTMTLASVITPGGWETYTFLKQ